MTNTIKNNPLIKGIIKDVEKQFGNVIFLGDLPMPERIPFESPALNMITVGGFAFGRFHEIVGKESSGKSLLSLHAIKSIQQIEKKRYEDTKKELEELLANPKLKKKERSDAETKLENLVERACIILDLEHTTDPKWARKNGVDMEKVIVYRVPPTNSEPHLQAILDLIETGTFACVVIDSLGAVISEAEEKSTLEKGNYGGPAKALTKFYKKAVPLISVHNVCGIVINQEREDLSGYNQLIRPGGKANKFAQSMVLWLKAGTIYDKGYSKGSGNTENAFAKETIIRVNKNKIDGGYRQNGYFTTRMGYGIDQYHDAILTAQQFDWVLPSGSWYTIFSPTTGEEMFKGQGVGKAVDYLKSNPEFYQLLWDKLYEKAIEDLTEDNNPYEELPFEEEE